MTPLEQARLAGELTSQLLLVLRENEHLPSMDVRWADDGDIEIHLIGDPKFRFMAMIGKCEEEHGWHIVSRNLTWCRMEDGFSKLPEALEFLRNYKPYK